jgi:hypothetical protein
MNTIDESVKIGRKKESYYKCASGTYFTLHDFQGRCLITRASSDSEQHIDLSYLEMIISSLPLFYSRQHVLFLRFLLHPVAPTSNRRLQYHPFPLIHYYLPLPVPV